MIGSGLSTSLPIPSGSMDVPHRMPWTRNLHIHLDGQKPDLLLQQVASSLFFQSAFVFCSSGEVAGKLPGED